MNYRNKDPNNQWLTTRIPFPEELKPRYDYLSEQYRQAFQNPITRKALEDLDLTQPDKIVKQELRSILDYTLEWPINNPAWWGKYVMGDAILRVLKSLDESRRAYRIVHKYGKPTNSMWDELHEAELYPTKGQVKQYLRGRAPRLPDNPAFVLDFTASGPQVFSMTPDGKCRANTGLKGQTEWVEWSLNVQNQEYYLREGWTGKLSKPRYHRDKQGEYHGEVSYEVACPTPAKNETVLGCDLGTGSVRHYTVVPVYPDGTYGLARVGSKLLGRIYRRNQERSRTLWGQFGEGPLTVDKTSYTRPWAELTKYERMEVIKQARGLTPVEEAAQARREEYRQGLLGKRDRCRIQEWDQESAEIVQSARETGAGAIHVEDLRWLGTRGGSWAYREVQSRVGYKARLAGVRVMEVDPAYSSSTNPVTGERGCVTGRAVVFRDGSRVDRDDLAGLNLGLRRGSRTGRHKPKPKARGMVTTRPVKRVPLRKSTLTPRRVRPKSRAVLVRERAQARRLMVLAGVFNKNLEVRDGTVTRTGGVNMECPVPNPGRVSGMLRAVSTNGPGH